MWLQRDEIWKWKVGYSFSVDFCRPGDSYREALLDQSKRIE